MGDLISRQAALDCFHDWIDKHGDVHTADEMPEYRAIEDLPKARMKGKWERKMDGIYCSACYLGWEFMTGVPAEVETAYRFCPYCGADMRGESDG